MKKKKYFETLRAAERFAEENKGSIRVAVLPGYNHADTVYVVEY